jgi:gamma-D-glutamyl-L-lysine dipeptidyl-peptidase
MFVPKVMMYYAICHVSAASMMQEASHKSELNTQVLFGETIEVLDTKKSWVYVKSVWDGYEGWCLKAQFTQIEALPNTVHISMENIIVQHSGISILIPACASIPNLVNNTFKMGPVEYTVSDLEKLRNITAAPSANELANIAKQYLQVPYFWGGRTHFGVDCSGFSAIVYKYFEISLIAKAEWQSQKGEAIDFVQMSKGGDLAFFDNEDGHIMHVGILLGDGKIIHAAENAGGVVIDDIDQEGIISARSGRRTHKLRLIKRYFAEA